MSNPAPSSPRRLSLKYRMLLGIGGCSLVGLGLLLTIISVRNENFASEQAMSAARSEARVEACQMRALLDGYMATTRALVDAVDAQLVAEKPSRDAVDNMLKRTTERMPEILGVWVCFEPEAFDGADAAAVGRDDSDKAGRFCPYWSRGGGSVGVEACDDCASSDYYNLPFKSGRDTLLEPYADQAGGKNVLISSVCVPIRREGKVVGVAGIDVDLTTLAALAGKVKLGENGYVSLVSQGGLTLAHPDTSLLGKPLSGGETWAASLPRVIAEDESYSSRDYSERMHADAVRIAVPLKVTGTDASWTVIANLSEDDMMATVHRERNLGILIGLTVLAAILATLWALCHGVARPLREIATGLRAGAETVHSAACQISVSSAQLADASSGHASAMGETSSLCSDLSSLAEHNSKSSSSDADAAGTLAKRADEEAAGTRARMEELLAAMREIQESSAQIASIVKSIDEIAFQTNILALNAAVEAARAGESGSGFAVVADEVRALAHRSAVAARETTSQIERSVQRAERGAVLCGKVAESLDSITRHTRLMGEHISAMLDTGVRQGKGVGEIHNALAKMEEATQVFSSQVGENASAAELLKSEADRMHENVRLLQALVSGSEGEAALSRPAARPAARLMRG